MSDEQIGIDFKFNVPEAKQQLSEIETGAKGVNEEVKTGNKPLKDREGLLERLKRRMGELRQEQDKAMSVSAIAGYNKELAKFEAELVRVSRAGRDGFDAYGRSIVSNEGLLQRLSRAAALYERGMYEATRPENLEKYSQKLALVNAEISKLTKGANIGGASQWNGFQNSINQISRELPAFTYSVQTGFMAISNNLPILVDEINRVRAANAAMSAEGKKGVPVWKQLAGGLLSWQTAMMVGITLLTVYGKEIGNFFVELFKGKSAINQAKRDFEAFNSVMKNTGKDAAKELTQLKVLSTAAADVTRTTKERKEAVKQLQELGKKHNVQMESEAILAGNLSGQYKELTKSILETARARAVEKQMEENATKRLELEWKRMKVQNANANEKARYARQGNDADVTMGGGVLGTSTMRGMTVSEKQLGSDIRAAKAKKSIDDEIEVLNKTDEFLIKYIKVEAEAKKIKTPSGAAEVRAENLFNQISKGRTDVLDKIKDLDNEYRVLSFSDTAKETEALKQKFADFRKVIEDENEKIRKYNAKNLRDVPLLDVGAVDPIEQRAMADLSYRHDTTKLVEQLNERKALYSEYEAYKTASSESNADKRFALELDKAKNYYSDLTGAINALQGKQFELGLTGGESERLEKLMNLLKDFNRNKQAEEDKAFLESYNLTKTYSEKIAEINDKYQKLYLAQGTELSDEKRDLLIRAKQDEIDQINETESRKNAILLKAAKQQISITTAGVRAQIKVIKDLLSREDLDPKFRGELESALTSAQSTAKLGVRSAMLIDLKKRYKELSDELVRLNKVGANPEEIAKVNNELGKTQENINDLNKEGLRDMLQLLQQLGQSVGELGSAFSNLGDAFGNGVLSGAGDLLSGLAIGVDKLSVAFDDNASKSDKYAAAVGAAVSLISMVANAAAERKRSEEEYYRAMIDLQHQYNMSLNDQLRLQSQLGESIYVKNYVGRMKDGMIAAEDAIQNYKKAVGELAANGKISKGLENAVDWKNVGSGAVSGAVIGAALGGPLALITGAIGAVVGGIIGFFAGKKKKPKYEDLYANLPKEIVDTLTSTEPKDLREVKALLESLNNDKAVDANTKQMVEGVLDWIAKIEEARAQIKEVVQELTGSLGSEMRNKLVDFFKQGEDAAKAMGQTVDKVLEDMMSQLLFSKAFDELFKQFEDKLTDTLLFGDEDDVIDVFGDFLKDAGSAGENFYKWMDAAKEAAGKQGMDIFQSQSSNSSLGTSGIERISEQSATEWIGLGRAQLDVNKQSLTISKEALEFEMKSYSLMLDSLLIQKGIEANTKASADQLVIAVGELKAINKNTGGKYGG